jgi:hypothetical protein
MDAAGWAAGGQVCAGLKGSRRSLRSGVGRIDSWRRSVAGEGSLDSEMIGERTKEVRMALSHGNMGGLDDPTRGCGWSIWINTCRGKDIIKTLASGIDGIRWDFANIAPLEAILLVLVPAPGVVDRITGCTILEKIKVGGG